MFSQNVCLYYSENKRPSAAQYRYLFEVEVEVGVRQQARQEGRGAGVYLHVTNPSHLRHFPSRAEPRWVGLDCGELSIRSSEAFKPGHDAAKEFRGISGPQCLVWARHSDGALTFCTVSVSVGLEVNVTVTCVCFLRSTDA